ncbi:MAG: asparagine synthase (glutamine-hydrolyzing) [Elusimicrobia bacterium]|nr:asparagine synthase (glutamine-hydrolyzing) [Elusimicrobiota bacterium]
MRWDGQKISRSQLERMTQSLYHRGPDDEGFYFSESDKPEMGLGFRRLSILDLEAGHQPMRYKDLRIVFNGEIYNFPTLKKECESLGHRFETRSDTEVILHLFAEFGEKCLEKLNGMFAFAIWNERKKELFLARDRMGIKPLYYYCDQKKFLFSSEMKSLFQSGEIPLEFDPTAARDFFSYRFVPAPYTLLKNVFKVPPAHSLMVREGKTTQNRYWKLDVSTPALHDFSDCEELLARQIEESVRMQLVSDVPLGAFLSGGVDSSLIAALMAKHAHGKIKTFSIGFEKGTGVDESAYARKVSQHLNTEHYEFQLTEKDLTSADAVLSTMNEPVADPTILPTAILSRFARREVKVVLTGEGGDELFAGYNRYKALLYSQWIQKMPSLLHPLAVPIFQNAGKGETFRAIPNLSPDNWYLLNRDMRPKTLSSFLSESGQGTPFHDPYLTHHDFLTQTQPPELLNSILEFERQTALADRLLMKVDMASMSASLEARPPYLDHNVVELAARIPARFKIRRFKGKYILRKIAARYLPPEICWRKKHGFIVPLAKWISAHPPEYIHSLLDESLLDSTGLFQKKSLRELKQKISNAPNGETMALFWPTIVLSAWLQSLKRS